ncbi:MAG: ribosome silencing factor [Sphingobacteriales bacterium]|nr:MAG: ribosome silencing factor [Sphingobacteriales bacterium]
MKTTIKAKKQQKATEQDLVELVVDLIQDRKGNDIVSLDLRNITDAITDFFIICHCESTTQTRAVTDHVEEEMKKRYGVKALHVEGRSLGEWCLLDFGEIVVHVFQRERREFYQLEELWHDATIKKYK